jgi:DedD protein
MMEKALKERIIGAIVLVAVIVLVVPVFLDGPASDDKIVSEIVPLPGQSEQAVQTVVLDRDRDDPVPAQVEPAPATQQQAAVEASPPPQETTKEASPETTTAAPEREAQENKPEPPATSTSLQSAGSTTGMWAVQLGSFSNQQNAEKLAADLRKQGFAAFLSQLSTSSGQLHRVRVGPQKDREAAEAMAARLQKAGHTGKTLPHP